MNTRDTMALLGYAAMLDDTVDLRDGSHGMSGGDPVRTLLNEIQRIESETVRLKIAHLRRARETALGLARRWAWCLDAMESRDAARIDRNAERYRRFAKACLAKIAELEEMQCSTKS